MTVVIVEAIIPFILYLGTLGLGIAIFATMYASLSALSRVAMIIKFVFNMFIAVQLMFIHRAWIWNLVHLVTIALYTLGRFPAGGGNGALTTLDRAFIYYGFIMHGMLMCMNPLILRIAKSKLRSEYLKSFDPDWTPEDQPWSLRLSEF
jgi:hypothetical protein